MSSEWARSRRCVGDRLRGTAEATNLQALAKRHLWMHFTRMGAYEQGAEVPIIERGEGCYVYDSARQALPRRALGAVLRQRRPRSRRAGRSRGGAGKAARLLHQLELRPSSARSNWPHAWPSWRRASSTACSSSPAARRRSSRPGSWPRPTTPPAGSRASTRSSRATWLTTAPRWGRSRSPACRRCASRSNRSRPAAGTWPTPTPTAGAKQRDPLWAADAIEEAILFEGPRHCRGGDPRAGAERRRLLRAPGRLLPARARDLRPPRRAADLRRGDLRLRPAWATGSAASATAASRTS